MPIVTTLHTILDEPSPTQRARMDELIELSERVVVMSSTVRRCCATCTASVLRRSI